MAILASRAARAAYLARSYRDLTADTGRLAATVGLLQPLHPREVIDMWQALVVAGEHEALADSLMERHYDPRYSKHRARMALRTEDVEAENLTLDDLPPLAARVAKAVRRLGEV